MSRPSVASASPMLSAGPETRLVAILELLQRAGFGDVRLASGADYDPAVSVAEGWSLSGGDPQHREALAQLVARVFGAESESESLCGEILERYEEAALVYRICRRLAMTSGESSIARLVVEEAARTLGARAGELWLRDGEQFVAIAALPDEGSLGTPLREQGPLAALQEGRPWLREPGRSAEAIVAVPLTPVSGQALGVLVLRGREAGRAFRTGELKLLGALCNLASAFLVNDRRESAALARVAQSRDAQVSPGTRESLWEYGTIETAGRRVVVGSRPSAGPPDAWCARMRLADDRLGLVLARVNGADVAGSLEAAQWRGALAAAAARHGLPDEWVRAAAAALGSERARTRGRPALVAAVLAQSGDEIRVANAGYLPPIVLRGDGRVESLGAAEGLSATTTPELSLDEHVATLAADDLVALCSWGLLRSCDAEGQPFGVERIGAELARARAAGSDPAASVLEALDRHRGSVPLAGDALLLVVEPAADARRRTVA